MTQGANDDRRGGLEQCQPIVLVGGASRRFGQDKLLARVDDSGRALVTFPVQALRAVFGRRVKLVGACDPRVRAHADGVIVDAHPGIGPIGGIASALAAWGGPIMVLAGDMPWCAAEDVRSILAARARNAAALVILAESAGQLHPCAGMYMPGALEHLQARIRAGEHRLMNALPEETIVRVPLTTRSTANINRPEDLGSAENRLE